MRKLLLVTVLALCAGVAQADNGMLYIGAGFTNDNLRDIVAPNTTNSNLNSTNPRVWAGVRPISVFALEASYIDLGSENVTGPIPATPVCPPGVICGPGGPNSTHLDYKAFAAYAVGYLPIPVPWVDAFAKAGVVHWTLSGSAPPAISLSDNSSQFAWGAGGQVHMGKFGARLEYETFSIRGTSGAKLVSLSVFLNLL